MPGTKRVINIGTNPDDGTGDLLRDALNKVNLNFDDVWEYTSVNSNLNITGDSINGTTDVIINPADTGAFKVTGDTIINPDGGNYNFTINGDLHNNVLYVQASTGRIGVHNTSPTVTLDITGDTKVSGMTTANNLTVTGNTILGDANTDTVTYNAKAASNFLPYSTTQNIGAPSNRWGYIYTTNLDVTGTIAGTFTGSMTSTLTGDVNNTNVTTVNANVTGPSNLTDVNISGNLVVQGSTTTLETTQVMVDNSIVFEGATDDAFETTLQITDPTADRTFTFPDATGTVATQEWANAQGFGGGASDTDGLTEGTTNLYFTNARADARADARITAAGSGNWNTAYGWGDHGSAGYLTSETFTSVVQDTTPQLGGDLDPNGNNIVGTGDFEIDVSGSIYLDADSGTIFLQDGTAGTFGQFIRAGSGDLTIASGSTQAVIFSGADAAFQGDVSVAGTLTGYQTTAGLNSAIDSHLNQSNPTSGHVLSWNGSDYAWVANSGGSSYSDSDVDTHLNQSNPTAGYVLSWNGSDYAWVSNAGGITNTDGLAEGVTNLYYTDARFDARLQTRNLGNMADVDTTGASNGQALVWSSGNSQWEPGSASYTNFNTDFDTRLATKDTGDLAEGSNLYYTDSRADARATLRINAASITNLNDVDAVTGSDDGKILYYDHSTTSFKWKTDATGSSTFGLAGNTGTHTFNPATETLTFLGTTGQINAGIAANNVTLELASDINSITSISFEGTTADANETKLQAVDPTADNTINLPNASGTVALTGDHAQYTFVIGNNGATDYTFSDADNHWFPSTENDPVLYLRRGETYIFNVTALGGSHPFEIRASNGGSAYNTGVTNNGASTGNITFKVPMSAPATLYYQCTAHSGMGNTINIV